MDVLLYKWLQLADPELSPDVITKDMKTDRLDVVGGMRREKKLVGIGDKEMHGRGRVLVVRIVL